MDVRPDTLTRREALDQAEQTLHRALSWELTANGWAVVAARVPDLVAALDSGDARTLAQLTTAVELAGPLRGAPEVTEPDPAPQLQPVPPMVARLVGDAIRAVSARRAGT